MRLQPYKRHYSLMGITSPRATVAISSEFAGKVSKLHVDVGDVVPPDGLVANIDTTFALLELEKNKLAQKETARQLDLERKNLKRFTTLITKNSTAQSTYDETLTKTDVLELKLKSLKNEEVILQQKLDRLSLRGPAGWLVIERYVEPGQVVSQGEPVILLGNFKDLIVSYFLSVEELEIVKTMEQILVYFPELKEKTPASIFRISPDIDAKARKRRVDLLIKGSEFDNTGAPGGGVRARLTLVGKVQAGLYVVPEKSLVGRYEAHWLTQADGKELKVIVVGGSEKNGEVVISGNNLSENQEYLLQP